MCLSKLKFVYFTMQIIKTLNMVTQASSGIFSILILNSRKCSFLRMQKPHSLQNVHLISYVYMVTDFVILRDFTEHNPRAFLWSLLTQQYFLKNKQKETIKKTPKKTMLVSDKIKQQHTLFCEENINRKSEILMRIFKLL